MAIALCVFLFCTLQTFVSAIEWNLGRVKANRLVTRHAVSLMFPMPMSYKSRIEEVPGVHTVSRLYWFGGVLEGREDSFFPNMAVEPKPFLAMFPEILLPDDQRRAFVDDRRGCIVGRRVADQFGWSVGDHIQMTSMIPTFQVGEPFEFVIRGVFDSDEVNYDGTDTSAMYFHFSYLYEKTDQKSDVGNYVIELDDPSKAAVVSAAVDALFENSDTQTKTVTEAAFRAGLVSAAGGLTKVLRTVGLAVTLAVLLVSANTMAMAFRERRKEIGVLKTLGFSGLRVMGLMLAEALAIAGFGGATGVLAAGFLIRALPGLPVVGDGMRGFPHLGLSPQVAAIGVVLSLTIGFVSGLFPALSAYRARITSTLAEL